MSTDKKGKSKTKHPLLPFERLKIIEFVAIGLMMLVFIALSVYYGCRGGEPEPVEEAPTPAPTADAAIRARNAFDALENAGYVLSPAGDSYDVTTPEGVSVRLRIVSDDAGIAALSVTAPLYADPGVDTPVTRALREQDDATLSAVRNLFDRILPVFHRDRKDSDTIAAQSRKVADSGTTYSARFDEYTLRIESDLTEVPQTVVIRLIRN